MESEGDKVRRSNKVDDMLKVNIAVHKIKEAYVILHEALIAILPDDGAMEDYENLSRFARMIYDDIESVMSDLDNYVSNKERK